MISSRLAMEASGWLMMPSASSACGGGVQLPDAAVDQHQARHGLLFLLHPLVAAGHHLAHRGEVVHALDALDDELAIVGLLHLAVFPHHHRRHRFRALDMRDVEALDALGQLRQHERVLQSFLDRLGRRLHHAEALIVGLLGILPDQVDQRALVAALRHVNLHLAASGLPTAPPPAWRDLRSPPERRWCAAHTAGRGKPASAARRRTLPARSRRRRPSRSGLPRRTRACRRSCRRACGTGSPPASRFRSDSRRRRHRRPQPRRCAASCPATRRSRSGRDTWPPVRTVGARRRRPCAAATSATDRRRGLRETSSRRERLRRNARAWSALRRTVPGSARCSTASTAADSSGSDRACTTESGSAGG